VREAAATSQEVPRWRRRRTSRSLVDAVRIGIFSAKRYDRESLSEVNASQAEDQRHELVFLETHLTQETAPIGAGYAAVCVFVNDRLDAEVLSALAAGETRLVALRCAGFNNVDLAAAARLGIAIVRVPAYSPYAVAEHTLALILMLNRKLHRAINRVREGNFSLDGLLGTELHGSTVGIVGTGRIGTTVARLLSGFGVTLLGADVSSNPECEALSVRYVPLDELLRTADVITLHCPLSPETRHLIDTRRLASMKADALLVNTSRGALIDTSAIVEALKSGRLRGLGIDVYEEEDRLFFEDHSADIVQDDTFARLLTFPNVIVTGHQAFFTGKALKDIARTTLENVTQFERGVPLVNRVS
jgi:D-lactate dehydrogenase